MSRLGCDVVICVHVPPPLVCSGVAEIEMGELM